MHEPTYKCVLTDNYLTITYRTFCWVPRKVVARVTELLVRNGTLPEAAEQEAIEMLSCAAVEAAQDEYEYKLWWHPDGHIHYFIDDYEEIAIDEGYTECFEGTY